MAEGTQADDNGGGAGAHSPLRCGRLHRRRLRLGDDFKDHFNQLAMAPSDWHKLGITFLSRSAAEAKAEGVVDHTQSWLGGSEPLTFVSERRLGFGTHGASNIAQRFSDALLDLFREDMDTAEYPFIAAAPAKWRERYAPVCPSCEASRMPCSHHPETPLKLLVIGHNPSHHSYSSGFSYSNPSNNFWKLLVKAGSRLRRQRRRRVHSQPFVHSLDVQPTRHSFTFARRPPTRHSFIRSTSNPRVTHSHSLDGVRAA